ncbi:MAG: hypothetical protein V1712_02035 [Patescibacteria group bacterium]
MTGFKKVVETEPKQHWWFDTLDLILHPIMKLFFHNKLTLAWHWKKWMTGEFPGIKSLAISLDGNKSLPKITSVWKQIKSEFKGKGQILINIDELNPIFQYTRYWRLCFWNPKTKLTKVCIVKIPITKYSLSSVPQGKIKCYVWGDTVVFFGINAMGLQIPIKYLSNVDVKNHPNVPLL